MADWRTDKPYLSVSVIKRLLAGEDSCEWSSWFRAHHYARSWRSQPSGFDSAAWVLDHTALLSRLRDDLADHYSVRLEGQNDFRLIGRGTVLAGRPDLIALGNGSALVADARPAGPGRLTWSR